MTRFIDSAREEVILDFIRDWVAVLAREDFIEAHSWLYRADRFSPSDINGWIHRCSTRSDQAAGVRVSDPRTLDASIERYLVDELEKPDENGRPVVAAEYFLPINGRRSSIRASFLIRETADRFAVELTDISVA